MRWRAQDLARALAEHGPCRFVGPDVEIDGASFDSRSLVPGRMFVPLVAERDGHEFVDDAVAHGAVAYLSSRPARADLVDRIACIEVADTGEALMDAARWARTLLPAGTMAVGITGSVGKTTTKDLVAAAISSTKRTVASERSYNNEQGLPVTILNAPIDTEVLVLEMGMRGFGQIDLLCRIGRPAIGVVTRVGEAHTSLVGGLDGVARAKGELVEALPSFGVAVLNADDDRVIAMRSRTSARVLSYGESPTADVRIDGLSLDSEGRARFSVRTPDGSAAIRLALPGRHSASNAAAAVAVGVALGVPLDAMAEGLADARVSAHRSNAVRLASGATLLDDCYNANPTSMLAALDTLAALGSRRRLAFLGLMAELDDPAEAHARVARRARELGIELVAVGTDLYGSNPVEVDTAIERLRALGSDDAALVKASRVAALERLVDAVTSP
ncbi:MAG: UDP-N-acetylmuramoylalanyl-D-glutamyl-2, 6-diaminopimelate--D-alanyl-D-alanine ligase [Acidimicrobiales bacterium mtb01]|nr:UDP-N-acetylmuramoyl-tripeptide--D-alanyl-D-alanine ligase [Actinomycetota bacterium]TEX44864.1 MAG: UDP-N-acetylmuramoylalanyl-D-glutamyl-2, 6-diaminopimelate--D-alanyl-D-alanine ligase [Acidimicrobiales bacterium mtb01]